jgi:hypothetical protein
MPAMDSGCGNISPAGPLPVMPVVVFVSIGAAFRVGCSFTGWGPHHHGPGRYLVGYPPKASRMSSVVPPACRMVPGMVFSVASGTTSPATMAGSMRMTA